MLSMTYGTMPTREQYDEAWNKLEDQEELRGHKFHFGNDPRMGTDALTQYELWDELVKAHHEFETSDDENEIDEVGDWMSSVLYCLNIEWI
jgi:hypothetical protein